MLMIKVILLCTEQPCVSQNVYAELDVGLVLGFLGTGTHLCPTSAVKGVLCEAR